TAHQEAFDALRDNRDVLDELVRRLFEKETLDKDEVAAIFEPLRRRPDRPAWTGSATRVPSDIPPVDPPPRPAEPFPVPHQGQPVPAGWVPGPPQWNGQPPYGAPGPYGQVPGPYGPPMPGAYPGSFPPMPPQQGPVPPAPGSPPLADDPESRPTREE
ncbi:MAG: cell division protein FtsH, partial [Propioniciclava sp.]